MLMMCVGRNTSKSTKKVASLDEEVKEGETRITELEHSLAQLQEEAKNVLAAQEKLRVGMAMVVWSFVWDEL